MSIKKTVLLKIGITKIKRIVDEDPEISWMDGKRLKEYDNGEFCFIGIEVETEILTSHDKGKTFLINHISSGGLWGIESDSEDDYFKEVVAEEMSELKKILQSMGFKLREIKASFEAASVCEVY